MTQINNSPNTALPSMGAGPAPQQQVRPNRVGGGQPLRQQDPTPPGPAGRATQQPANTYENAPRREPERATSPSRPVPPAPRGSSGIKMTR